MRALLLCLLPALAVAQEPTDFAGWEEAYQFDCNGPFTHFATPDVHEHAGYRYQHTGGTVKVERIVPRSAKVAKLGLLAGIKDLDPETKVAVQDFLAAFEKADVDAIIIGGDTSEEPAVLDQVYAFLAETTTRPLLAIAGNTERAGAHSYAINKLRKAGNLHLLNLDTIRRFDGEGVDVVSLAGYHDRRYLHLTGGCIYQDKDLDAVTRAARAADDAVVFLSHGPPRQRGQKALDYVPGADNVGDDRLTALIKEAKIPFGVFGHILEAGGRGTDLAGKLLPQKKWLPALYVNQGSANPLPWKLNDGSTSYGLAAILSVQGKRASYEVVRAKKPPPRSAP